MMTDGHTSMPSLRTHSAKNAQNTRHFEDETQRSATVSLLQYWHPQQKEQAFQKRGIFQKQRKSTSEGRWKGRRKHDVRQWRDYPARWQSGTAE